MHLENLVRRLEHDSMLAIEWFDSNNMKLIQDNCHFQWWVNIWQTKTWESRKQKLLGITIKGNLHFDEYVLNQCKKAARKLSVVTKICQLMSLERRRTLMKSFIELQFGYCLLVWMFCGGRSNNHINPRPKICISPPWSWPSICVCLFFVLQLKSVIVTVSTYINSASTYMYELVKDNVGNK